MKPTFAVLSALILEGISLKRQKEAVDARLEVVNLNLRDAAEQELRAMDGFTDLPGSSWSFAAADGSVATVSFPKPGLVRQIQFVKSVPFVLEDKKLVKLGIDLREVCGLSFSKLFAEYWKPGKAFRELAPALLPPRTADKLIRACETLPGTPRVNYEVAGTGEGTAGPEPS